MRSKRSSIITAAWVGFALVSGLFSSARSVECAGVSSPAPPNRASVFREYAYDAGGIARDPSFYLLMTGLVVTPKLLPHEDLELNERWSNSTAADNFFEVGDVMGNTILPVAVSGIALTYGRLAHRWGTYDFGSDLLRAQFVNGVLSLSLKWITNRRRPDGTSWSFPSGHTSTAFSSAAVVYRHFGWKFGIPALATAAYVGLSRLQENKHYLSDIIAGAILGGYVGLKISGGRDGHGSNSRLSITPVLAGNLGVNACIRF